MRLWSSPPARVVAIASIAGAIAVAASSGCIALVCFDTDPCAHGSGGAGSTSSATSSVTGSGATSTGTATTSSSTGSSGMCADPTGCNGVDCLGGACVACVCEPVAIDLGAQAGRVAASGTNVYVAAGGTAGSKLYGLSKTFDGTTSIASAVLASVPDALGFVAASSTNVAYSPSTDGHLVLCDANGCAPTTQAFDTHVTGMAFDVTALQFGVSPPTNGIGTLKPFKVNPPNVVVLINEFPVTGSGTHTVRSYMGVTYWSDLDGCLYAEPNNIVGQATCLTLTGLDPHIADFVVGAEGVFVADTAGTQIYRLDVNLTQTKATASLVPDDNQLDIQGTGPLGLDATRLYVGSPTGIAVYTYVAGGSPKVATIATSAKPTGLDASDPKYLFYTVGQQLFRWTKPKP